MELNEGYNPDDGEESVNWEVWNQSHLIPAPPRDVLYHVALTKFRKDIQENGLKAKPQSQLPDPIEAVYFSDQPKDWLGMHDDEIDTWAVNAEGLELFYDPEMIKSEADFAYLGDIPASRIALVETMSSRTASTTAVDLGDGMAVIKQTSEYTDVTVVPSDS